MYRIRSADGAEAVYNSLEEFTAAVRRGEVAPEDEIFHQRANRWLDVKSHPHYRSAMNWSGQGLPGSGPVSAPPASVSTPPPRPAVTLPGNGNGVNGHPRTHGADRLGLNRPVPPTVYRAQVPSATPQPPAPPQKTKELTFIDLGAPAKPASPVNEPPKPPPAQAGPTAPHKNVDELDFLVMATGLDSPVRKSNGHKVVTEDLDLLFDTPVTSATPPAMPVAASVPPVAPPEPPKPRVSAPRPTIVEPPRFEALPPPIIKPPVALVPQEPEIEIPGPALLDGVLPAAAHSTHPVHTPTPRSDKTPIVFGVAAVVVVITGGLLLWRPWSAGSGDSSIVSTSATTTQQSAPPAGLMPQGLVTGGTQIAVPPTPAPAESVVHPAVAVDSGAAVDTADVVIAEPIIPTPRAEFTAPVDLGTPDLTPAPATSEAPKAPTVAPAELVRRIELAERQAQQELAAKLVGFRNVFGAYRLDTREGVNQARTVWNAGADAIRQYRARIGRLEQAYEDSVLASQRAQRWSGDELRNWATRRSLAEPAEVSQLADLMFSQVAEGLDILTALENQYDLKGNTIRFKNPASGTRFMTVRTWVTQRMENWSGTPETARPYTVSAILLALGQGLPAVE